MPETESKMPLNQLQGAMGVREDLVPINIVLDIDELLATVCKEFTYKKKYPELNAWLKENSIKAGAAFMLLSPGVVDFIKYLYQLPNCEISFFSSAIKERNHSFVTQLLERALGFEEYQKIKEKVRIFSKHHLVKNNDSSYKKDLNITLLEGYSLSSTVIIDDNFSSIIEAQKKNILKARSITQSTLHFARRGFNEEYIFDANNIFYIAGLLKTAIDMGRLSLADNLFNLQFKPGNHGEFKPIEKIGQVTDYFLLGLTELRKQNPKLNFYGKSSLVNKCFYVLPAVELCNKEIKENTQISIKQTSNLATKASKCGFFGQLQEGYDLCLSDVGIIPFTTAICKELLTRAFIRK